MKCEQCPALVIEGYEYPEEMCAFGIEGDEFKDGTYGCRKTRKTIERDLAEANRQFIKYLEENAESWAKFWLDN